MPTTITNITPTLANGVAIQPEGHYNAGTVITLTVAFSEIVFVDTTGGTPTLELATGTADRFATYTSGSDTDTLTFTYTVQAGDDTDQLAYSSTHALALNGATIQNNANEDADLTLATPGEANSLSRDTAIVLDTEAPVFDINPFSADPITDLVTNVAEGESYGVSYYSFWFASAEHSDNRTASDALILDTDSDWEIGVPIGAAGDLILTQTAGLASSSLFPIGTTTNTFTLTDKAGNVATDVINVTVSDSEPPTAVADDTYQVFLEEDGTATVTAIELDNGSTDNDIRGIADYKIVLNPNTSFEQEVEDLSFTEEDLDTEVVVELDRKSVV